MPDANPFLADPRALRMPWIRSPLFDVQLAAADVDEETKALARRFRDDGYVVLEGAAGDDLVERILAAYPWLFDPKTCFDVVPNRPRVLADDPRRRQDAWVACPPVRELAVLPRVLDFLRFVYQREPVPFQTLNFELGTEQAAHSDSFHFNSVPAGFMCGAWVALEDMDEDNGPLVYYPGSHLLPEIQLEHLGAWPQDATQASGPNYDRYTQYVDAVVRARNLEPHRLVVPRGTVLIWDANLLHGGSPIADASRTRKSQVTHYFFEGCVYYSPVLSCVPLGEYRLKVIHDIVTGERVGHSLNGAPLGSVAIERGRDRLGRDGRVLWPLGLWRRRAVSRVERFLRKRRLDGLADRAARLSGDAD